MNLLINSIRRFVRQCGFDVVHYNPLNPLLLKHKVDLVLDVGANAGQTYDLFRQAGYDGKIVSFDPNPKIFAVLNRKRGDNWEKQQLALSSTSGEAEFFTTAETGWSGLHRSLSKPTLDRFKVRTERLDKIWSWDARSAFLKIDTEGHDLEVVRGAAGVMDRISLIMVEAVLDSRYEGEPTFCQAVKGLAEFGFRACKVQQLYPAPTQGVDTGMDLVFCR
jgi:FkbM family methyltransferase